MKNPGYLEQHFQTWLPPVANIRINYAETLAQFLRQPGLFNATLFKNFLYTILWLIHYIIPTHLEKKSIVKSTINAVMVTPRFASSSLMADFTTEEMKLVAR